LIDEATSHAIRAAREARARVVIERSTRHLIDVLCEAGAVWSRPQSGERAKTASALYGALSLSPAMIDHGLDTIFHAITEAGIRSLIETQVDDPTDLDRSRSDDAGHELRLLGPDTIYHSLAGNIPGLAVTPIVCGILARSVTLIRDSRRQPLLTRAFCDTLRRIDPLTAALIVPLDASVTADDVRRVIEGCDARVELHGSDTVVDELTGRFAGVTVSGHGTRSSALIATAGADAGLWAARMARDIAMYEGLGCLTPHTLIVEVEDTVESWCSALAAALDDTERVWPRARQSLPLEAERRAFLERAEVSSLLDTGMPALRGHDDAWCIAPSPDAAAGLGPGMRCIAVLGSANREASAAALKTMPVPLAGLGLTMELANTDERAQADDLRARTGATWICPAGEMQSPPLGWQQDGCRRLGDLLAWRPVPA